MLVKAGYDLYFYKDDSKKQDAIYTVQEGSVKFEARALDNKKYSVNQQVCVKIPLGDMTSDKKIIEGTERFLCAAASWIKLGDVSYIGWLIMAIKVTAIVAVCVTVTTIVFYRI